MHGVMNGYSDEAIILFIISLITVRMKTQALHYMALVGFKSLAESKAADQQLEELTITTYRLEKELQQLKPASGTPRVHNQSTTPGDD